MTKILIVDDEESIRVLLSIVLAGMPEYSVLQAKDGPEAIAMAEAEKPDVIVLDNKMPGMSGLEACRRIKSRADSKKTKIIILSCQGKNFDWEQAKTSGADDFLTKPFDTLALMEKLRELAVKRG